MHTFNLVLMNGQSPFFQNRGVIIQTKFMGHHYAEFRRLKSDTKSISTEATFTYSDIATENERVIITWPTFGKDKIGKTVYLM